MGAFLGTAPETTGPSAAWAEAISGDPISGISSVDGVSAGVSGVSGASALAGAAPVASAFSAFLASSAFSAFSTFSAGRSLLRPLLDLLLNRRLSGLSPCFRDSN